MNENIFRHVDSPRYAYSQIYPAIDVTSISNNGWEQSLFSWQNVHCIEISTGSVSPSQSMQKWCWTQACRRQKLKFPWELTPMPSGVLWLQPPELTLGVSWLSILTCNSPGDKDIVDLLPFTRAHTSRRLPPGGVVTQSSMESSIAHADTKTPSVSICSPQ